MSTPSWEFTVANIYMKWKTRPEFTVLVWCAGMFKWSHMKDQWPGDNPLSYWRTNAFFWLLVFLATFITLLPVLMCLRFSNISKTKIEKERSETKMKINSGWLKFMTHSIFHQFDLLFWEDIFLKILYKAILEMSLMYSLQIFVKLVPFITAHNSDIYSHIEVYSHNFKLFNGHHSWPEQEESNTGSLYLRSTAACAI